MTTLHGVNLNDANICFLSGGAVLRSLCLFAIQPARPYFSRHGNRVAAAWWRAVGRCDCPGFAASRIRDHVIGDAMGIGGSLLAGKPKFCIGRIARDGVALRRCRRYFADNISWQYGTADGELCLAFMRYGHCDV